MRSPAGKVGESLAFFASFSLSALVAGTGAVAGSRIERRGIRRRRHRRKRSDGLFAPLRDHLLVLQPDTKPEQLAHVGRRSGSIRKSLLENALIALIAVAVIFLPRHQVGAQRLDIDGIERIQPDQEIVLD